MLLTKRLGCLLSTPGLYYFIFKIYKIILDFFTFIYYNYYIRSVIMSSKILFELQTRQGKSRVAKEERNAIIDELKLNGCVESGVYSRAGLFQVVRNSKGYKLVFGTKWNIAGKYFSLVQYFNTQKTAIAFAKEILKVAKMTIKSNTIA
jgi:hypothetical protein